MAHTYHVAKLMQGVSNRGRHAPFGEVLGITQLHLALSTKPAI